MASIHENLSKIINAVFGRDIRQALHDGLDAINKETESTTSRQDYLDRKYDEQIKNMTVQDPSSAEIVDMRVAANGKTFEKAGDRLNYFDEQLGKNVRELDTKINEVAEKGTTVEVIERATKEEVERQIEDGSMALLTIEDKSLTDKKIKDKSINFELLDEDIQQKTKQLSLINQNIDHKDGFVMYTGKIQQISDYAYKKIPVKQGETIFITSNCVGAEGALAVFIDKNDKFISYHNRVSEVGKKYYIDEPVEVPENSDYVLICTKNKHTTPVTVKKYLFTDVVNMDANISDIKSRLTKIVLDIIGEDIPYSLGFITSGGTIQDFTTYKYKIIPVKPETTYYVTTRCSKNSGTLAYFYDSNNERLGNYKPNSELETNIHDYVNERVTTPRNCHYVGIVTTNSDSTPIIVKEEIYKDIDVLDINNITDNLKGIKVVDTHSNIDHTNGFVTATGNIQQIGTYAYKKIPMTEGEELYVTSNCIGTSGALAVFMTFDHTFISYYKKVSEVGKHYYVDEKIVAPPNCAYVLICTGNKYTHPVIVKKAVDVTFTYEEFKNFMKVTPRKDEVITQEDYNDVLFDNQQLKERIESIDKLVEFDWKPFDKGYVVIIIDDGRHDLCKFLEIFKEYNAHLSCALMTSNLYSVQDDGRYLIDVALDIQKSGGEVLSHSTNGSVFTEATTDEDANERFRTSKKILSEKGLNINGFVKPGGTGSLARLDKFEHLVRKYYRYGYSAGYSNAYSSGRYSMTGTLENLTSKVDSAIKNKSKVIFYSHSFDADEVTEANLRGLLQYINDRDGVEVVTTKYLYDNFASNTLENRILALENK